MSILTTNCMLYTLMAYYGSVVLFCVVYNTQRIVKIMWKVCRVAARACAWLTRKIKKKFQPPTEDTNVTNELLLQELRPDMMKYDEEYADFQYH